MSKQTKTVSIKAFVYYKKPYEWDEDQSGISFSNHDFSSLTENAQVLINSQVIQLEVPVNFDPRPQLIKNIEAEQRKAAAAFEAATTARMRQISELQALEMS